MKSNELSQPLHWIEVRITLYWRRRKYDQNENQYPEEDDSIKRMQELRRKREDQP